MRVRRLLAIGLWSSATLAASGLSFAIVSTVTAKVITNDLDVPRRTDQVSAGPLASGAVVALEPTTTTVVPTTTTTAAPPATTTTTAVATTTTAPPPAAEPAPPVTAAADVPATFSERGGVVAVTCTGAEIRLDSARPEPGFRLRVDETGPERVVVNFGTDREFRRLVAACGPDGAPQGTWSEGLRPRREGDRSGPGDGGGR